MEHQQGRHIPEDLKRQLLVEAGHRCAIPTCKQGPPLQFCHIESYAAVKRHEFSNIIVMCARCHDLHTHKLIDQKAMRQYKANLGVLNSRYGEYERRVLTVFGLEQRDIDEFSDGPYFVLPRGRELDVWYLMKDRMIEAVTKHGPDCGHPSITPGDITYRFTPAGRDLVRRLREAQPIE
ncbi:HNH endonuclease signature motif containing protein [Streptomyces sp. ALI-76-A]|uniref:HNH endonuclease signature motif containing protein n=1 Tax=Streptomyces sp. ALI-76-A TaxID=3025736 RepID=UPI00256F058B|nr:HNH endonuclease signature motif containing protein [Streptomyces sp. ALI-76-A]MDL5202933.1 HNH endonuclease signature motif containing protein [Streptomyces sp. ALI-76-A]